jgi:DUF971 family protein
MLTPEDIQRIGREIAVRWSDGSEDFYPMELLRAASPSAENRGERDLLGKLIGGGQGPREFPGVEVVGWQGVGGYAVQFQFSDGHATGIYSFDYLKSLGDAIREGRL